MGAMSGWLGGCAEGVGVCGRKWARNVAMLVGVKGEQSLMCCCMDQSGKD